MARVYATAADYQTYTGQTPPAGIDTRLERASRYLDSRVLRMAWYDTDTAGMPTDAGVTAALRDATCAQAQWWEELGDETGAAGAGWGSVSIGSASLSRSAAAVSGGDSPARQVAPAVWDALQSPDLDGGVFRLGEVAVW